MIRVLILAAALAASPALAAPAGGTPPPAPAVPAATAPGPASSAVSVDAKVGEPIASAAATYDVPTAAPGDAPSSPTILDASGDVLVTGSVGAPSRPVPPPARACIAAHAACPLPPVTGPGQVCECFIAGIGSEQGIAE